MSRRAYPQNPALPSQSTFPVAGGGYPGQSLYSPFPSQTGPPGRSQPPIGAGYPRQPYPSQPQYHVAPSQGVAVPPVSTSSGPKLQGAPHGQTVLAHGGHTTLSQPSYQQPVPLPSGSGMAGPPPPPPAQHTLVNSVTAVTQVPPTGVASMTTGVGQMHLGPQSNGN